MSDTPSIDDDTLTKINEFRKEVDADPELSEEISSKLFGEGVNLAQLAQDCGYDLSSEDFLAWIDHIAQDESVQLHDFELALVAGGGSGSSTGSGGAVDCSEDEQGNIDCDDKGG